MVGLWVRANFEDHAAAILIVSPGFALFGAGAFAV